MQNKLKFTLLFFICVSVLFGCSNNSKKSLTEVPTLPTQPIIYSTEEINNPNGGKIEGTITSAKELNKPLPEVIVDLEHHPFFEKNNPSKVLARTKTDSQGRYSFDNVEPGVYTLQIRININQGGPCDILDLTKIIKIEVGTVATVNLGLTCRP